MIGFKPIETDCDRLIRHFPIQLDAGVAEDQQAPIPDADDPTSSSEVAHELDATVCIGASCASPPLEMRVMTDRSEG